MPRGDVSCEDSSRDDFPRDDFPRDGAAVDRDLVDRVTRGSRTERAAAFEELFLQYRQRVFRLCLHVTRNHHEAEDAVQEIFLAVHRALPGFRGQSKLSTWIHRIALRTAIHVKSRRPRNRVPLVIDIAAKSADAVLQNESAARLWRALSTLSADHRAVIALFAVEGLSHSEIAEILGVPEGTVWSRLHLARKRLAEKLGGGDTPGTVGAAASRP